MFERYNERARRAIFFARWWALNRPSRTIETRDLILGLVHEHAALDSAYGWLHARRKGFLVSFADGVKPVAQPTPNDIPLTDNSKKALAYAAMEADLDKRTTIDPFHLFRGILRTGDETAQKLAADGYSLEAVREVSRLTFRNLPDRPGRVRFRVAGPLKTRTKVSLIVGALLFVAMLLYLHSQN